MQRSLGFLVLTLSFFICFACQQDKSPDIEKVESIGEWTVLFDGTSLEQWQSSDSEEMIPICWKIENGELESTRKSDRPDGGHASLLTKKKYSNFEFTFEFKLEAPTEEKDTNSGVKYFVYPDTELGLEYQVYAKVGEVKGIHAIADLYDILPATGAELKPFDEWNSSRIVSNGSLCEHWLNGVKVLEYERGGEEFRAAIAKSKFKDRENFGELDAGHIMLQDHGGGAKYRNVKIKEL